VDERSMIQITRCDCNNPDRTPSRENLIREVVYHLATFRPASWPPLLPGESRIS
jgi:hypothetical protein